MIDKCYKKMLGLLFCLTCSGAWAAGGYNVVKMLDIDYGFFRLNNLGQVAGQHIEYIGGHAYYRPTRVEADGTRRQLDGGQDFWGGIQDINDQGIIVGSAWNYVVDAQRPVWWDMQGTMHYIEVAGSTSSRTRAINQAGLIVGNTSFSVRNDRGWTWQNGRLTYADTAGYGYAFLADVNDGGVIVGKVGEDREWHAALWRNGVPELLPGGAGGNAVAINEFGWIAGNVGSRAVLWRNGVLTELGEFEVTAMNNRGEILGHAGGYPGEPVLWRDGRVVSLDALGMGSQVFEAYDINDRGQILMEVSGDSLNPHTLALATPVPEPGQLALLLAGLPVLALARRRRRQARQGLEEGQQVPA